MITMCQTQNKNMPTYIWKKELIGKWQRKLMLNHFTRKESRYQYLNGRFQEVQRFEEIVE